MTFCIGIRVSEGLVALADTKIVKGEEQLSKSKISFNATGPDRWWLMTSGLRSIRDKTVTYLEERIRTGDLPLNNLFQMANLFGEELRRVRSEDGASLLEAHLQFNLHAIIGGKLANDQHPKMYYIYPEGNWIESNSDSPYFIIGRTHYAKPIIDRLLRFNTDIKQAAALGFLAFDATRASVTDVDYPIDMVVQRLSHEMVSQRFDSNDLEKVTQWWNRALADAFHSFPHDSFNKLFPNS